MERPSPSEIAELSTLIEEATQVGDSATAFSAQRLRTCVLVGDTLNQWKGKIPRGEWGRFIEQHFPALPERSCQRWMRLAEASTKGTLNLESARGLRHAYQLAGLLPDSDSSNAKSSPKAVSFVVLIARLVASLQHIVLDHLKPNEKNDLKVRLKPVMDLYQKL